MFCARRKKCGWAALAKQFGLMGVCLFASNNLATAQETASAETKFTSSQLEFFELKIRPVLAEHCYECHSGEAKKLQAALRVDSRQHLLRGGDSGPTISLSQPDESLLLESVRYEGYEMPPSGKLPDDVIADIETWVQQGAPWPDEELTAGATVESFDLEKRRREHWVWQPIESPDVPEIRDAEWPRDEVDRFILHKLEEAGASPAPDVDEATLVRRLYFDITGLPPEPKEVLAFLQDSSTDKLSKLIDRLLESPHFGERWGRHWLDLVRYAESRGHEFDNDARNAFQYRDYVIRALNADVPYDQFVREHIAGDLLKTPRLHPQTGANESVLGTGFWFLGEWVHSPVDIRKDESDRFDNMIDVMSKTFLGVTVSCARCHDHKFDAISTEDYYALSGFLQSSDYRQVRFESIEKNRKIAQELHQIDRRFRDSLQHLLGESSEESDAATLVTSKHSSAQLPESLAHKLVANYCVGEPQKLKQNGFIFGREPRLAGQFELASTPDSIAIGDTGIGFRSSGAAVNDLIWQGLESVDESGINRRSKLVTLPRPGRTLRTETFLLTDGQVDCLVQGEGHVVACVDSHRLVAGPLHGETVANIKAANPWVRLNLSRYVGHRLHLEFTPAKDKTLAVQAVIQGASGDQKSNLKKFCDAQVETSETQAAELSERLQNNEGLRKQVRQIAQKWSSQREALRQQIVRRSHLAMAMMDGSGEDDNLLIRGSSSNPGRIVPRRFLSAVQLDHPVDYQGSGRLQLADQINAPDNPLASRVIVNRIWHHLFGRGIVPTTDDFGVLGQAPTHPELLDHLAVRFRGEGMSIKRMIKALVLSRTYRMSGVRSPEIAEQDPNNLLWHFRPPKRLQGEAIRDALLAVSGELNPEMFGQPIPVHLTDFMTGRGRPGKQGPLDGGKRRSIYTAVRRNFLPPFMLAFDTPVPFSSMGRRTVSNVPAQALIMLNHPLVRQLSTKWAERSRLAAQDFSRQTETNELDARITWLYLSGYGRRPTASELDAVRLFVESRDSQAWEELAHALVNAKEFIYLR